MEIKVDNKVALIDKEDYEKLSKYKWRLDKDGYAVSSFKRGGKTVNIKMHQMVLGKKDGFVIDHINNNKLDNRKSKLRHVTRQANAMNMKKQRGVYWNEQRQTYIVQIRINAKTIHVGCRKDFEEAVELRRQAEEKHFAPIIRGDVQWTQ